jgi:hypothetical protein
MNFTQYLSRKFWLLKKYLYKRFYFNQKNSVAPALIEKYRNKVRHLSASTDDFWQANERNLIDLFLEDEPSNFLNWNVIRSTMFAGGSFVDVEWQDIKSRYPKGYLRKILKESPIGNPDNFLHFPTTSTNMIHHFYHADLFQRKTGVRISDLQSVFEFGGGYGDMVKIFRRLGFNGRYTIYDLPAFSLLQQFYIDALGLLKNVEFAHRPEQVQHIPPQSMFIATWSFGETPLAVRDQLAHILPSFNHFLIAYSATFIGVDNVDYFQTLAKRLTHVSWVTIPIPQLEGHYYLFGTPLQQKL